MLKKVYISFSFLLFLSSLSLISCDRILDHYLEKKPEEKYSSEWRGTWKGTYSGNRSGTITIEVYKKGFVNVTLSGGINEDFLYGIVYDGTGAFQSTINASNNSFFLYGNLVQRHGTWKQGNLSGEWSVTKQ